MEQAKRRPSNDDWILLFWVSCSLPGAILHLLICLARLPAAASAEPLLRKARRLFPFVERIIGDAGYQGAKMAAAVARTGPWKIEIVRCFDKHKFVVLPKRWIVERTIGWIGRNRRLARDFERHSCAWR